MAYTGKTDWTNNEIVEASDMNRIEQGIENSVEKVVGKGLSENDYTTAEKNKLSGIAANANNYSHPTGDGSKHVPANGTTNNGKVLKAGATAGTYVWANDNDTTYSAATTSTTGLMSATDKSKLDGIAAGANNYTHPTTAGNKHVPTGGASGQVLKYSASGTATWQADSDTVTTVNGKTGAIAKSDITALGIPAQDTVYSHPASHAASMITESSTKRFVTDSEKASWNSKAPGYTYGTADLTAGSSTLATGTLYFVYE